MMMFRLNLPTALLASFMMMLLLSACAGPRATERGPEPAEELPEPVDVRLSDFEDFDVSVFRESPPDEEVLEHDVPDILMESRAGEGSERVVQGFRIQIASSVEKDEAVVAEEAARRWWRTQSRQDVFPAELPTYVVYRQPYYRVRIGNFPTRADAAAALSIVESQFPGSFIVPDTVTLRSN